MSQLPTYVSRLDPQFRRFVNVVNVYPSSDTSASNEDLSKDRASSVAFSSCSDLSQEFITVDAYTEDNWPPTQGSQRRVSELFLEYATILSSESETSYGNDSDIATCSSASLSSREDPRNLSNSEQRYSHNRIRYDCFEDDSVFWSEGYGKGSHEEKRINQCLQERPAVSYKQQTVERFPEEPFSSKADSESSYRLDSEPEGRLEYMEETVEFFDGKDFQGSETIYSPVSRHLDQEVISRYPQGTSRQIADSFDDLSSIGSEFGYAQDVIEDGYSSTSSADSSFVCFALTGKQDDQRPKRKIAAKDGRVECRKKHRHTGGGKGNDRGLKAYVVTGITGGPAVRVFRDENKSTKSKSRPPDYPRKDAQHNSGRADGSFTDHGGLKQSQFRHKSTERSGNDSVFALIAAPGNSLVKDGQSSKHDGKWRTEKGARYGPAGVDVNERVSAGTSGHFTPNKPYSNPGAPKITQSKMRVQKKRASKYDEISSKRGDAHGRESIYEPVISPNTSTKYDKVDVMPNAPTNTPPDYQQSSQDKSNNFRNNSFTRSRERVQPSHSSEQMSMGNNPSNKLDERKNISQSARQRQLLEDPTTARIMREDFQGTALPVRIQSTKRAVRSSLIRGSAPKGQKQEGNLDSTAPTAIGSELRLTNTGKASKEMDGNWPPRKKNWISGQAEDLSGLHVDETMDDQSSPLEPVTRDAFDSHKDHKDTKTARNLLPRAQHPNAKTWTDRDSSHEECVISDSKGELFTPVKKAIHRTVKGCLPDTGVSDDEWEMGSMEEDQVCPEIKGDGSHGTESEIYVDVGEDQRAATQNVDMTEGRQTGPGDIRFTEIKGYKRIISSKKRIDVSFGGTQRVTSTEDVNVVVRTHIDKGGQEVKLESDNQSTPALYDAQQPPVDDLHAVKIDVTDSKERKIDKRRLVDVVSQRPRSQQRTNKAVIEGKPEGYRSTEGKESERLFTEKTEQEVEQVLEKDSRSPSIGKSIHSNDESIDVNNNNCDLDNDSNGFSLVPVFKRKAEEAFCEEEISKKRAEIIQQPSPSYQEDEVEESMLNTESGVDAYSPVTDENCDASPNVIDGGNGSHMCETDNRNYQEGVTLDSSLPLSMQRNHDVIPQEASNNIPYTGLQMTKEGNRSGPDNTAMVIVESNVSAGDIKLSTFHDESAFREKASEHFSQQPNVLTTFSGRETSTVRVTLVKPQKRYGRGKGDTCEKATRTDVPLQKDPQLLVLKEDSPLHHHGSDNAGQAVAPKATEENGVTEDVCFVAFDVDESASEVGAWATPKLIISKNHDEIENVLDCKAALSNNSTEPDAEIEVHSEVAELFKDGEVDANSENPIYETEVDEVVCSYEEQDSLSPSIKSLKPDKMASTGEQRGDIQVTKATTGTVDSLLATETATSESKVGEWELIGGKGSHSSSHSRNEKVSSSQFKADRKDDIGDSHGRKSCVKSIHCDCLQEYLLQNGNTEDEREEPVASVKLEKLEANSNVEFHTGTQKCDTFAGDRSYVKAYADKTCQVALLDKSAKPEFKTKYSQTSFSHKSVNAECQTNEAIGVNYQGEAVQHQSVECQTEIQSNAFASVGIQVKVPDQDPEDKSDTASAEYGDVEEEVQSRWSTKCQYIDKDCQTSPEAELLDIKGSSRFPSNDNIVMLEVTESSHRPSLDSKECQTSRNSLCEFVDTGTSTAEDSSNRLVFLESKECQTSFDASLVTSSAQCEILTLRDGKDGLAVTAALASSPTPHADKDCQTLPDSDLLHTASKECQTLSWPHTFEENGEADEEVETSYESKECQTLLDNDFLLVALKGFQTSSSHYTPEETEISYESKECQTSLESDHIPAIVQQREEEDEKCYESKETQTYLDPDLLFAASKECQTYSWSHTPEEAEKAGLDTEISYDSKECQTLLESDLLLATSKYCQTSPWYTSREVGSQTEESVKAHHSKGCQTFLDSDLLVATSKQCQTSWFSTSGETTRLAVETETFHHSKECQTEVGVLLASSRACQTVPEFDAGGPFKASSEFQAHQYKYVSHDSKDCQTDPGLINGHGHLWTMTLKTDSPPKSAGSFEANKGTCETKESQTPTSVTSSKLCQTSSLQSATDYHSRESQTLPDGDAFLSSSKECQTVPYSLEDLKLLIGQVEDSKDVELFNDAEADKSSITFWSTPMGPLQGASRPATYGKSPDTAEESIFEFSSRDEPNDTDLCQTGELGTKLADAIVPINFAEIGCQAVLCHCGNFVDEHTNDSSCSSNPQSRAAMRVSEGMQKEQASLIKQLDILRDMNQKLRDDKDAIEAAHEAKKNKVPRQGSQMSKYVKRRRNPSPEDTWGNQGLVESLSGDDVDGGSNDRRSVSLHGSIQEEEEAEFEGDPTLEIISDEKAEEMEQPVWAKKIMSFVQTKEIAAEKDKKMILSDEELEEDVFRRRKVELISAGTGRGRLNEVREESDMSLSEELSDENGSTSDDRPTSPRAAPVGKDNDMQRVGSQDMSDAGVSAMSEPPAPERVFKVVFVGDSGVGKSSFIHRFCHDAWKPSFTATIGVDFQIKTMNVDGRYITLQLWDTAGQERFRSITKQYFRKADGVIVFYDVTMETSFLNIKNWMISVEEGTDDGTAIMIVGNKTDLIEEDSERPVRSQDGKRLAEEYKALYTETSAKTGFNIQESMAEFSKMLQVREDELMQSVLNLVQDKPTKKKCCK